MKILIVDDEKPARDRLTRVLDDIGSHDVVGTAANGDEAISAANRLKPEVVLLDIRMPGVNGIEVAHHLNTLPEPPAIVFTTAYDEYAIDAFEALAIGYVLKPVRRNRLARALEHAARISGRTLGDIADKSQLESQRRHVCARTGSDVHLIPLSDVSCFIADQKYVRAYHSRGSSLIGDTLKSLEQEFADDFVRIHRGALVAVGRVNRLEKLTDGKMRVVLRDAPQANDGGLIVSRRHLPNVRRRLQRG